MNIEQTIQAHTDAIVAQTKAIIALTEAFAAKAVAASEPKVAKAAKAAAAAGEPVKPVPPEPVKPVAKPEPVKPVASVEETDDLDLGDEPAAKAPAMTKDECRAFLMPYLSTQAPLIRATFAKQGVENFKGITDANAGDFAAAFKAALAAEGIALL